MRKPRTRKEMVEYLTEHPRHLVENGYSTTYSYCIKVDHLGLTSERRQACAEMLEVEYAHEVSGFLAVLRSFDVRHHYEWRIYTEGRSGGYLVLHRGHRDEPCLHNTSGVDHASQFPTLNHWSDFDVYDLKARVDAVWDFDETCAAAVAAFVQFSTAHKVVEQKVRVTKTVKVIEER